MKNFSILISMFMYLFTKEVHNFNQTVKQSNLEFKDTSFLMDGTNNLNIYNFDTDV